MKRIVASRYLNEVYVTMKRMVVSGFLNELSNNEAYGGIEIS
jgi:hypothetical protein